MKIKLLLIVLFVVLAYQTQAQSYNFSASTGTYADLAGSTSLNNGLTWDDPQYTIPIGFNFQFFDTSFDTLYIEDLGLGGVLTPDSNESGIIPILVPYGADIIDRGYDFAADSSTTGSLSNISYLLEGTAGSRILKVEWKNVGFYSELWDDSVSTDFTNFQMWLYEGSNDIEVRFGPNSITQPNLSFDGETGSFVALFQGYDVDEDTLAGEALILSGDPTSPTFSLLPNTDTTYYFNGVIPNGTIYTFSMGMSNLSDDPNYFSNITLYPNPARDAFQLSFPQQEHNIQSISIYLPNGQKVKEVKYAQESIDVSDLSTGIYFVRIHTQEGTLTRRMIKR